MAHFAKINSENVIEQVIVIHNDDAPNEATGIAFLQSLGLDGVWKQTSYNTRFNNHIKGGTPFRKNFAGIGFTYDPIRDAFIPPKPENINGIEYVLNEETCLWELPVEGV